MRHQQGAPGSQFLSVALPGNSFFLPYPGSAQSLPSCCFRCSCFLQILIPIRVASSFASPIRSSEQVLSNLAHRGYG